MVINMTWKEMLERVRGEVKLFLLDRVTCMPNTFFYHLLEKGSIKEVKVLGTMDTDRPLIIVPCHSSGVFLET